MTINIPLRTGASILAYFLVSLAPASAFSILEYEDATPHSDVVPGAVSLLGGGYSLTVATSQAQFNTLLSAGGMDLVIFGEQAGFVFSGSAAQLSSYVGGGGKMIAATFDLASGLLSLMQGTEVSRNASVITTTADPIYNNPYSLGASISLNNPGWITFDQAYLPVGGAQGVGTLDGGFAVIRGNGGRTLLNGPLFDSYASPSQGQSFVADEILSLATPVPEPSSLALAALAGVAIGIVRRRK